MHDEPLYLRHNVQVEPLVDQWYAWSHLIPPATAARNITERHLKIMDSYITAPQAHANAVKNPKMLGGPFIDYDGKRVDEIRALRDSTIHHRAGMLQLSKALADLDALLRRSARGYSMHPLYASVPEILRGLVELTYDLNNNPSFRLIEPLLYHSPYYDRRSQTLMLSLITGDDRPFVLSTPRLQSPGKVTLNTPFDDQRVDAFFRLKNAPEPWSRIRSMYDLEERDLETFRSFFTPEAPPAYPRYEGPGLRWRYFGHACILLESKDLTFLFDPVLSYTYETDISRYTYRDLPDHIDYVIITHNHQDHMLFETMLQLRHKIRNVVVPRNDPGVLQDPSLALILKACGFKNVIEVGALDSIECDGGTITAVPFFGEHGDLAVATKAAYLVNLQGHVLMFAADSCNVEPKLYRRVRDIVGDVDVLFLGMECVGAPLSWLYGPLIFQKLERVMDESRRLNGSNFEQALDIVDVFGCRDVYVYAMGQEPWLNYVMSLKYTEQSKPIIDSNRLIAACKDRGITAERLFGEKEIQLAARDRRSLACQVHG